MEFGKLLSRAWQITWRWKVLWVFGFLVSLGQGSRGGNNVNWVEDGWRLERFLPEVVGILIALLCLGLIVGIALWVLSVIGRGALIGGVQQVEEEGSTDLRRAWRVGVSRFWTLFGLSFLTGLPVLILALLVVAAFVGPILTDAIVNADRGGLSWLSALSFLCGAPLCCGTIVVGIVLSQIRTYAERAAVLEGLGWIDAFRRGWQVLKENIGPTVVFWLILFAIGAVFAIVVGGGLLVLAAPFVALFTRIEPGAWALIPICGGGLLVIVASALIGSVVQTFTSATWTLAYRGMTRLGIPPIEVEPEAV
ncbi:MAG: hypothetical protein WBW48_10140 [Anaerolineae bacterium]